MGGWNYETDKNQTDVELADFFGEAWTNFAKNGKPTTDDSWKPVTTTDLLGMEYLDINPNRGMKAGYRALDRIQFTRIMPVFVGPLPPAIPDYNNGSRIGCPGGWAVSSTNSKKCYNIFHFSPLSQTDAQRNCYIKSNAPTCTTSYIGLMRHGTTWKWMNSDNSTYLNWEAGNPSTDSSATCAVINSNDGKWSNQACAIPQCYLCSFDF
uniref:C-type lectin domain-containing protein n=1 Tax=Acrobeloides nanus TaxID=290746 RepID=A0A914D2U2_9BILA